MDYKQIVHKAVRYLHGWMFGKLMHPKERLHFMDVLVLARELKEEAACSKP